MVAIPTTARSHRVITPPQTAQQKQWKEAKIASGSKLEYVRVPNIVVPAASRTVWRERQAEGLMHWLMDDDTIPNRTCARELKRGLPSLPYSEETAPAREQSRMGRTALCTR
jgi:hypothetical protein